MKVELSPDSLVSNRYSSLIISGWALNKYVNYINTQENNVTHVSTENTSLIQHFSFLHRESPVFFCLNFMKIK